jgi:curved DNA-binding protein CbpA
MIGDPYRTLRVSRDADAAAVAAAYRRLARKYHPDVNPASDATQRMRELNQAYEILRDPLLRATYDSTQVAYAYPEPESWAWPTDPDPEPEMAEPEMAEPEMAGPDTAGPETVGEERWRVVFRVLGTLITLLGIVGLVWPRPFG